MAHSHSHAHGPAPSTGHAGAKFSGRLAITFVLTAGLFAVELIAGLISGSLALVADASHMATDVVALGASLVATKIAVRPDQSRQRSYGRYRAEVFAAGLACLLMVGAGAFVVIEAIRRINDEPDLAVGIMFVVGSIGLAVNLVSLLLLRAGSTESLNVRGAYLEVLGDAAGSAGVLVAAALIQITGSPIWDLVVAIAIGVFVLIRAAGLARSVLRVLGQHIPEGLVMAAVEADLAAIVGVTDVHDLHVWALTSGMNVASAHLRIEDDADAHLVLDEAQGVLARHHHVEHATVQVEPADHRHCHEVSW